MYANYIKHLGNKGKSQHEMKTVTKETNCMTNV